LLILKYYFLNNKSINLVSQVLNSKLKSNTIISTSYAPNVDEWGRILTDLVAGQKNFAQSNNNSIEKLSLSPNSLENKDFIWLMALNNDIDKRKKIDAQFLKRAHELVSNLWFVSVSGKNPETQQLNVTPSIDTNFFTILSDYSYPVIPDTDEEGVITKYTYAYDENPKTSFATPLFATIIKTIRTLSPSLSFDDIKTILQKTADNKPNEQKEQGYAVNFKKAYEFTIGSLLANAQKEYYENCGQGHVFFKENSNSFSWKIKCNNNKDKDWNRFDYAKNSLNDFFNTARVTSVSDNKINTTYKHNRKANPNEIIIDIVDIDFKKDSVRVEFTKKYKKVGDEKQDNTQKESIISYANGKPQLKFENIVK
jgi:hypothetical protein